MKKYLLVTLIAVSFSASATDIKPAAAVNAMPSVVATTGMADSMKMSVVTDFVKSMSKRDAAMLLTGSIVAYLLSKSEMVSYLFGQEETSETFTF